MAVIIMHALPRKEITQASDLFFALWCVFLHPFHHRQSVYQELILATVISYSTITTGKVSASPFHLTQANPLSRCSGKFLFTTSSGNSKLVAEGDPRLHHIREVQTKCFSCLLVLKKVVPCQHLLKIDGTHLKKKGPVDFPETLLANLPMH